MHVRSDVGSRWAAISPTEIATANSISGLVHTPSAASSLDPLRSPPYGDRPHRGLPVVPGAHAGDIHERSGISSRDTAITAVGIANDVSHRRARTHTPSAESSRRLIRSRPHMSTDTLRLSTRARSAYRRHARAQRR